MSVGSGRKKRGFVLLMVLVVLAIAGTILATSARRSGQRALDTKELVRQIQLRWGAISCRDIVFSNVSDIFEHAAEYQDIKSRQVRKPITLGSVKFDLILSDEQAKANINLLAARFGSQGLTAAMRELQADQREILQVFLKPGKKHQSIQFTTKSKRGRKRSKKNELPATVPIVYESYDQLFRYDHPSQLLRIKQEEISPTDRITFWGNGKLNLARADVETLRSVLSGLVTEDQIVTLANCDPADPTFSLQQVIDTSELDTEKAELLTILLTDESECFSLWVIGSVPTRRYYRLFIADKDIHPAKRSSSFYW